MKSHHRIALVALMAATFPLAANAQLSSIVNGLLSALPDVMSNVKDKIMMQEGDCERERDQKLADIEKKLTPVGAANPEAANQLRRYNGGMVEMAYRQCAERYEKAKNGSVVDGQVVSKAVGGVLAMEGALAASQMAGAMSAATGSNTLAMQAMGYGGVTDPTVLAKAMATAPGGMPGMATGIPNLPVFAMAGVMTAATGTPSMGGVGGTAQAMPFMQAPTSPIEAAAGFLGGFLNAHANAFSAESVTKILDKPINEVRRDTLRSTLATQGILPENPEPSLEAVSDTYKAADAAVKVFGCKASQTSIGYVGSTGEIALIAHDITAAGKSAMQDIMKRLSEKYGDPVIEQAAGLTRAVWNLPDATLFLASESNRYTLGWKNTERANRMIAGLSSGNQQIKQ